MDFALTLFGAVDLETIGKIALNILLVILGINALIIVHEFGHFIVARMCGVRCEKFYIWFDFWGLKFFSFKWGDTEYGLGVFPLGGYVKMLGQEDNPGELRAEMERARHQQQPNETEWTGEKTLREDGLVDAPENSESVEHAEELPTRSVEELQEQIYSPDSYLAKSVPQRLAIIVAGVTMNFLFAIVCATGAYLVGFEESAPAVGNVIPGSPAWEAELQVGDRILELNDKPIRAFMDINASMVGAEDGIKMKIRRPEKNGTGFEIIEKTFHARKRQNDLSPTIGINALPTTEIAAPLIASKDWSPVGSLAKKYYSKEDIEAIKKSNLFIQSVDGQPIFHYADYLEAQLRHFGQPVACRFVVKDKSGQDTSETVEIKLPAIPMKEIGVRFTPGPITMVLPGSDAEKQGIKPGDVILAIDGDADYDPLKLPQIVLRKQNEGRTSVDLLVRKVDGTEQTLTVTLDPDRIIPKVSVLSMKDPMGSTALGLAWTVEPIVAGVMSGSAAEEQKLPIGGKVLTVKFVNGEKLFGSNRFSRTEKDGVLFHSIGDRIDIPHIFDFLLQVAEPQAFPVERSTPKEERGKKKTILVRLEIAKEDGGSLMFDLPVVQSTDWFHLDRGLNLKAELSTVKIDTFGEALSLGTDKMVESSLMVFKVLEKLFSGGISPRALGGPVMIVQAAYMFADKGLGSYLLLLCLIGANLAVINILPWPVLDGGHVVFLLYEGIFRRPPNETVLVVLSYIGLAMILALMVWVVALDVGCIARF